MFKGILIGVISVIVVAIAGCGADEKTETVSSKDFGDAWPFTVEQIDLLCDGPSPKALARTPDGVIYALSGSARSNAKDRGWADGHDITKSNPSVPSIKMDYSDFVKRAQALCDS
ncbi:Protein of uncharacterised function (DUF2511) [Pseudomonas putida]|nr:Protein of uncharacterised function (DUF2511) [Pseudomonas putida]CAB5650437.1 Protein of uncharacterised function (DUF2511) [Pseudomonas putida]CAB5721353.1 Protein of uncharacterised function (DUF2511) [Pseudomonas putida]CAB5723715.1 Protein of uncharacterised function (DUF2511) [Pseudomonas putida]CAC9678889.1 Protein of uncharacterised function (DUF2511) [Pseudomonas putida]